MLALLGAGGWSGAVLAQEEPAQGEEGASSAGASSAKTHETEPPAAEALGPNEKIARGILQFEGGRYDECISQLQPLVGGPLPEVGAAPDTVERARVYLVACYLGSGDAERATVVMELAIRSNPQLRPPDLLVFPQAVVDVYLQVRQRLLEEIRRSEQQALQQAQLEAAETNRTAALERARVAELELLAMEELVVVRNHRWIAAVPYGAGQFQNGNGALGWVFLGTEAALTATVIGSLVTDRVLSAEDAHGDPVRARSLADARQSAHDVLVFASWGLIATALGGIAEAELNFVPETNESRRRPLPERLRRVGAAPMVAPSAVGFGVGGVF